MTPDRARLEAIKERLRRLQPPYRTRWTVEDVPQLIKWFEEALYLLHIEVGHALPRKDDRGSTEFLSRFEPEMSRVSDEALEEIIREPKKRGIGTWAIGSMARELRAQRKLEAAARRMRSPDTCETGAAVDSALAELDALEDRK